MKNLNCYGNTNKKLLIDSYYLKPILYVGLLSNQEKNGCCGKLTDRYYIFKATNKKTKKASSFYVGKHCAEKILDLINVKPLKFFNPFNSQSENSLGSSVSNNTDNSEVNKINPINKELIQAISIISMAWDYPPPISVLNIVDFTSKLDAVTINKKGIFWVNKNLKGDNNKRTLSKIYFDLKKDNYTLQKIHFENLKKYIKDNHPEEVNRY